MSMPTEAVEALHAITAELKAEHERMAAWLAEQQNVEGWPLQVSKAEGERIFADRIAKHEAKLKEQGWTRTIRVEPGTPT